MHQQLPLAWLPSLKNLALSAALVCALISPAIAQQLPLPLEDCFKPTKRPIALRQLQWVPAPKVVTKPIAKGILPAEDFTYVVSANGQDVLLKRNTASTKPDTLLKASDLKLKALPSITITSATTGYMLIGAEVFTLDWATLPVKKTLITTIPEDAENTDLEPKSLQFAYTVGPNLYIKQGAEVTKLTNEPDGTNAIVNGHAAHQREFGITKGTFWSGDGAQLAYFRINQSMVPEYPIVDMADKPAKVNPLRYPMAGTASHHATLGVYNVATKSTIIINPSINAFNDPEQYLTNITFSPDNKFIYIAVVNRDQNHVKLQRYHAATGQLDKTLFEERHPKYVEPENGPQFLPSTVKLGKLSGPDLFIWMSKRDGHNHAYLYQTDGTLKQQITKGNFEVLDITGIYAEGKNISVHAQITANRGLDKHLALITIADGKLATLIDIDAQQPGIHTGITSPAGRYLLNAFNNPTTPYQIGLWDIQTKATMPIYVAPNPLAAHNISQPELVSIKAGDGSLLNGRLIKPNNMVAGKKYPTIVYVYGGPHVQLVTNGFNYGSDLWMYHFAQEGYVVFTLDGRGSGNRGLDFENVTHRQLGRAEMLDQLAGVAYLKTLSFVDSARLGVQGWSFGGFMTTSLMTRHPNVFKAGCAGGAVIDWSLYEIMYTERYMDSPQQNPDGYAANNLKNYAKNLKGKLMLIHGTVDDVVLWQHTQQMASQLIKDKKLFEYMLYPGHPHNVIGADRVHLFRTIKAFFDRSL